MSKVYLKGLDGLRGIAAILVVIGHVELMKKVFNFKNVYDGGGPFFLYLGNLSVTFFFALSGFLITFLLLKERDKFGDIRIKFFYLRRVLKIWPVYYILFILGFIILPIISFENIIMAKPVLEENFWNGFIYNIILFPNFTHYNNPIAFQSWSIGVEEQFYIFWPLLIGRIRSLKWLLITMLIIVFGIYFLRSLDYLNTLTAINIPFFKTINLFFGRSRFDNMALGGILAIVYYIKPNYVYSQTIKIFILLGVGFILLKPFSIGFGLDNPLACMLFCFVIYWVINIKKHTFLENTIIKFLGRISYGIYMYHILGIIISINLCVLINPVFKAETLIENIILYILVIAITVLISFTSYKLMEVKILKLKTKYE